jgi:hypothetical protein
MTIEKSYYAIIPANVRYDENLTANAKLLYGEITALCNEKGYCWANNSYFAELYHVSNTSISKWISQLIDSGYVESEIIYREGSKQVESRTIKICVTPIQEKLNTPLTKIGEGIQEKLNTPTQEKLKDNNTDLNNTINNTKKKKSHVFIKPDEREVKEYFRANGYTECSAEKFYKYYSTGDWHDAKGNPVRNWKQKAQSVWFKPENEITENKKREAIV